jgi:hypothetical protein
MINDFYTHCINTGRYSKERFQDSIPMTYALAMHSYRNCWVTMLGAVKMG